MELVEDLAFGGDGCMKRSAVVARQTGDIIGANLVLPRSPGVIQLVKAASIHVADVVPLFKCLDESYDKSLPQHSAFVTVDKDGLGVCLAESQGAIFT